MRKMKKVTPVLVGMLAGAGIVWTLGRRRAPLAALSSWQRSLARQHGAEKAGRLAEAVRQEYTALLARTTLPEQPTLRWHLKDTILPGVALYKVLLQEHKGDQETALAEVDETMRERTLIKSRRMLAPLWVWPRPFQLFKMIFPQVMKQYPAEGWDIAYVENSPDRVAFNITRCFYRDRLAELGAAELTASFCKGDDVMGECFPPSIRFVRPHTMGRGDEVCDFQYVRVETG